MEKLKTDAIDCSICLHGRPRETFDEMCGYRYVCDECNTCGPACTNRGEAIAHWNNLHRYNALIADNKALTDKLSQAEGRTDKLIGFCHGVISECEKLGGSGPHVEAAKKHIQAILKSPPPPGKEQEKCPNYQKFRARCKSFGQLPERKV